MDPSETGGMGWLSSLLGGGQQQPSPTSLAAPGVPQPQPDSAGLPVDPSNAASGLMKGLGAFGGMATPMQKIMQQRQGAQQQPQAPQIQMPQQHPQPYAQALAQIMAKLNPKTLQNPMTPQGTQPS